MNRRSLFGALAVFPLLAVAKVSGKDGAPGPIGLNGADGRSAIPSTAVELLAWCEANFSCEMGAPSHRVHEGSSAYYKTYSALGASEADATAQVYFSLLSAKGNPPEGGTIKPFLYWRLSDKVSAESFFNGNGVDWRVRTRLYIGEKVPHLKDSTEWFVKPGSDDSIMWCDRSRATHYNLVKSMDDTFERSKAIAYNQI